MPYGDRITASYTSKNHFWTSYINKGENCVKFARRRAAFDVWFGMLGTPMDLNSAGNEKFSLLVTDGRYLVTGWDRLDQTEQNGLEIQDDQSSGYFVYIYGSETMCLSVYVASHTRVQYPVSIMQKFAEMLRLEKVAFSAHSVSIGIGYHQHGCCSWWGSHCLWYHAYLFSLSYKMKEPLASAYGARIFAVVQLEPGLVKESGTGCRRN